MRVCERVCVCVCMLKTCPCPSQLSLSNWELAFLWMKLKAHCTHHSFLICRRCFTLNAAGFLWFPVSKGNCDGSQAKDVTAKPCRQRLNYRPRNRPNPSPKSTRQSLYAVCCTNICMQLLNATQWRLVRIYSSLDGMVRDTHSHRFTDTNWNYGWEFVCLSISS